ncbi:hypothetical protein QOT17_001287 [Balamuthia mandrillaris]
MTSLQWLQEKKNHKDDPLFQELSVWVDDNNNPSEGEEGEQRQQKRKAEQQLQERPTDEALLVTSELESLAPIASEQRTWGALHFAAIWMALAISVPTYMIGSSLLLAGLNWYAFICVVHPFSFILPLTFSFSFLFRCYSFSFVVFSVLFLLLLLLSSSSSLQFKRANDVFPRYKLTRKAVLI